MFASLKKKESSIPVSESSTRPQRRPPSTPPLHLRSLQLVAKQPGSPVVLRKLKKVKGQGSVIRESWPGAVPTTQVSLTPPLIARPIPEAQLQPSTQLRPDITCSQNSLLPAAPPRWSAPTRALPVGLNSDSTMMSLLLFCHSASSSSLPAIDNKIEQAMDLVKSHLMLAVREEVELLREQIREQQEKNQQLERENHILRALTHSYTATQQY
uniref:TSC22 domain family, member 2 n=1 Tax=Nothobranchius furzeri TaxID=105023 RepID=A0A8C6P1F3_NOTFU